MTPREILEQKLTLARADLKTAGPIHRRDLKKHIHRMERELRDYDRFQSAARRGVPA
ncbi:MAG: hypothetical protein J6A79_13965 [Clostridia bacterium]|nr:hypothetical protein [Clostridia bacterium]